MNYLENSASRRCATAPQRKFPGQHTYIYIKIYNMYSLDEHKYIYIIIRNNSERFRAMPSTETINEKADAPCKPVGQLKSLHTRAPTRGKKGPKS